MKSFNGKNVFLTGAASGIGRALANQFAASGCNLYLVDIDEKGLKSTESEIQTASNRVWTYVCDLSQPDHVKAMLSDFDQRVDVIDILVNNAGVAYYGPTEQMGQDKWDWLMNINLLAPIQITNHFVPQLLTRPDAHIANMCSISGMVAGGRFAAYNTSKFGLIGFTEALRSEYGRKGLGVSAICPGPVSTNLYKSAAAGRDKNSVPEPPAIVCATPERVASKTIHAIKKNKRQQLITPMAYGLYHLKQFAPGLIDFASQVSRKKKKRLAELQRLENERLASLPQIDSESADQASVKAA